MTKISKTIFIVTSLSVILMLGGCASNPALHGAILKKDYERISKIAKKEEALKAVGQRGFTALHLAAKRNDLKAIEILLAAGADPNLEAKTRLKELPIHQAMVADRIDTDVISVFLKNGNDVNAPLTNGATPLFMSLYRKENSEASLFLIDRGADINAQTRLGTTPLHRAISTNNQQVATVLVTKGAEVNVTNDEGETPLYLAVKKKNVEAVDSLMLNNADPNFFEKESKAPLIAALSTEQWDMVRKILPHQMRMLDANLIFKLLVISDDVDLIQAFLQKGYDTDVTNKEGVSPIHLAAMRGNLEVLKLFLDSGVDLQILDKAGHNPLYYAVLNRHKEVSNYLLNHGSNIIKPIKTGEEYAAVAWTNVLQAERFLSQNEFAKGVNSYRVSKKFFDEAGGFLASDTKEFSKKLSKAKVGNFWKMVGEATLLALADAGSQYQAQQRSRTMAQYSALNRANSSGTGIQGYNNYMARYNSSAKKSSYSNQYSNSGMRSGTLFTLTDSGSIKRVRDRLDRSAKRMQEMANKVQELLNCYDNSSDRSTCSGEVWE